MQHDFLIGDKAGGFTIEKKKHIYTETGEFEALTTEAPCSGNFISSTVFSSSSVAVSVMERSSFHPLT